MSILPAPIAGQIVSCLFPLEGTDIPGDKIRPVLIIAVFEDVDEVLVAYGTSNKTSVTPGSPILQPYQIEIDPSSVYGKSSGLKYVTRFNFRRAIPIKYNSTWFKPFPGKKTISVGALHKYLFNSVYQAYQHALPFLNKASINKVGISSPIVRVKRKNKFK
ncbi:MAG TPA: hypothetical protein DIC42_01755 [Holosporales bacterium]|nr:hypothetical protein [Holosporales bacterium]